MKILFKLLKILGIILLSLIVFSIITVVVAKIYEDDLASYTIKELESEINAPMSIGEVSLIPLFSFPNISAEVNKLYIGDPNSKNADTLFYINSLKLGLDSWDLVNGKQTIDKLEISGLDFEYIVNTDGKSNIDFLINSFLDTTSVAIDETEETELTVLDLSADKFKIRDIKIRYFDSLNHIGSNLEIPEINIKAKTKNNVFEGKTDGSFILSHLFFEDTKANQMESCVVEFDLEYENNTAKINALNLRSEGIDLGLEGTITDNNGYGIDATLGLNTLDLNTLKKYIPEEYLKPLENTNLASIKPIQFDLLADYNEEHIDIKNLALKSDGIDIGAKGSFVINETINIDTQIQSFSLDLAVLKEYIPSSYLEEFGINDLTGIADVSGFIKGQYADSIQMPKIDAIASLRNVSLSTKDYPNIDTVNLTTEIKTYGNPDFSETSIKFSKGKIVSTNSKIQFNGSVEGTENPKYSLNSDIDIFLEDFASLVADSLATSLKGNIVASFNTTGVLPENITDEFVDYFLDQSSLSMQVENVSAKIGDTIPIDELGFSFQYTPLKPGVKNLQLDKLILKSEEYSIDLKNSSFSVLANGKMSDPMKMGVQLNSYNIQNGKIRVFGNGFVNNFEKPEFDLTTSVDLQLKELMPFVPDTLVKSMSGFASAKMDTKGKIDLDSLDSQMMEVLFENSSFELTMANASIKMADSLIDIDKVFGRMELSNDILNIPHFNAHINGMKVEVDSTQIRNIYNAVLLNQHKELYVNSHFKIGDFIFDDFKHLMAMGETETVDSDDEIAKDTIAEEPQNWTFLIHGSASVNSIIIDSFPLDDFNINKLHINDMSALFKLTDSAYIIDQFKFKVFEGETNNSIHYKVRKDGTQSVSTKNLVTDMNIQTMLRDMDNFGMDSLITYNNISGLFSTDLNMFIPIEDSVRMDKMMISGDLTLEKGGVYDYDPAKEVSKFTGIKELDNIQFKTLRSNIFMFKNKLYVPRTNIVSNAIDIAAFGMQDMDGDSEYHMEIHLSNILFGKSKRRNKKQNEGGDEIDEKSLKKSSRKIRYEVIDDESKVGLDSKNSRENMMNKIRVQRKMLDFIFLPQNIHYNTEVKEKESKEKNN